MKTSNETKKNPGANGNLIWRTMEKLRENRQSITRKVLGELTGLPYTIVDDHTSRWIDNGRLRRISDGVYELPEAVGEPRSISVTVLPNGTHVVEMGDEELRGTVEEMDTLGRLLQGGAMRYVALGNQHQVGAVVTEAYVRNRQLSDRISDLERALRAAQAVRKQQGGDHVQS
ncbi:hypothetical protein [Paracidovorax anthurii]|uniref:Uncharacterized protein n=1 Tax=Paracidovorax anthurii TaxID=78229 RepID=A0A328ZGB0_9BURK|nr:hypothetical protein [Paracidovorax anthurii]RAR85021.1 hypothetical protein AX018_1008114 [Paracidovorax anthurii]